MGWVGPSSLEVELCEERKKKRIELLSRFRAGR